MTDMSPGRIEASLAVARNQIQSWKFWPALFSFKMSASDSF